MFAWGAIVLLGCGACLWLIGCLKREHARHKAVVYQAMTAIDNGASPNIWLASLKDQEFALDQFCHSHVESLYPGTGNFPRTRTNLRHGTRCDRVTQGRVRPSLDENDLRQEQ